MLTNDKSRNFIHRLFLLNIYSYHNNHLDKLTYTYNNILVPWVEYLQMKQKKHLEAKVVMVGDVGVGKSSITVRYVLDKFDGKM